MSEPMLDDKPATLDPYASLKRALVLMVSGALMLLNRKLGFNLSEAELASFAGVVSAYLLQSGIKSGMLKSA